MDLVARQKMAVPGYEEKVPEKVRETNTQKLQARAHENGFRVLWVSGLGFRGFNLGRRFGV